MIIEPIKNQKEERMEKSKLTVMDGFRFAIGFFIANQVIGLVASILTALFSFIFQRVL